MAPQPAHLRPTEPSLTSCSSGRKRDTTGFGGAIQLIELAVLEVVHDGLLGVGPRRGRLGRGRAPLASANAQRINCGGQGHAGPVSHTAQPNAMKALETQPTLVEQVHKAILGEISGGRMRPGTRIIQEQLAKELGVSRQPVQQALALLRNQGVLHDAPGRGLLVAALGVDYVRNMYYMRAVIEGLACRRAAEMNAKQAKAKGPALIRAGRKAVASGSYADMIATDMAFHHFIYDLSENPFIEPTMEAHWTNTQRVMGEVLVYDEQPRNVWDQHEAMLEVIAAGDGDQAEAQGRAHIQQAAEFMIARLQQRDAQAGAGE
jgi:DNA-binding GntR family transcriptional regulator